MAKKKAKAEAKLTKFADFKKKAVVAPHENVVSIEELLGSGAVKGLAVPSEAEILSQMKNSGVPQLQKFADALEREKKGEKVDMRQFSDL